MTRATWLTALLLGAAGAHAAQRVETIDATVLSGQVISIDDKALILRGGGKDQSVPRGRLVSVSLDKTQQIDHKVAQGLVVTHRGDALGLKGLQLDNGRLVFSNALLGRTQIALSDAKALFLPGKAETARDIRRRCETMKIAAVSHDILVVAKDNKLLPVQGVLKRIAAPRGSSQAKVFFRWQETDRTISLSNVRAIVLAKAAPAETPIAGTLIGRDGTRVAFSALTLTDRACKVQTVTAGARTISRNAIAGIRFVTVGADDLSSMRPTVVKEYGFFDRTFPHRLNLSAGGGPLRLNGREYATGLGLHSFCELTYALDGKYARLVTVAGIDDAVRPAGNAELSFLGDGRPLGKATALTGKDRPAVLRVDVTGVKTLTIRVGFGSDGLDVADHVDLAAARLIKAGT